MKTRLVAATGIAAAVAAALVAGCQQQEFPGSGLTAVAMDSTTPAFFTARDSALYIIERRVDLPIRVPTAAEQTALDAMPAPAPYAHMPWVLRGDIQTEVQYTLSNLEDHEVTVAVMLNGYNEFHEFVPLATIVENEAIADYSNYEWTIALMPGERYNGTIRTEKIDTAAVNLACIGNLAPNDNLINYPFNEAERDARITAYVPSVVPGLTGFRLGMRAVGSPPAMGTTTGGAPKLVLEATVRVQSSTNKLLDTHDPRYLSTTLPDATMPYAMTQTPAIINPVPLPP